MPKNCSNIMKKLEDDRLKNPIGSCSSLHACAILPHGASLYYEKVGRRVQLRS